MYTEFIFYFLLPMYAPRAPKNKELGGFGMTEKMLLLGQIFEMAIFKYTFWPSLNPKITFLGVGLSACVCVCGGGRVPVSVCASVISITQKHITAKIPDFVSYMSITC